MDPVPRVSETRTSSTSPALAETGAIAQEHQGEAAEDPFSTGPQALPYLLGMVIAVATVVVPIFAVVSTRPNSPAGGGPAEGGAGLTQPL
ncbi:hypothetical protein [Cyanobium sp. WAJ14-Wanaka]|uniref:hypothetical protein n=1 Tax=Cyanobium sp. WAJ14-Wanaka TaxID=2823725 RepID=UPI0020CDDF43|nr:hypothetical protein [Cyanobium sp. WAJ14-Wanaka]MCP9774747.1 hypothetical protein [Cyanobium sp. WAJ14-Wanaka]